MAIAWSPAPGNYVFLSKDATGPNYSVWRTDATPQGTVQVAELGDYQILGAVGVPGGRELFATLGARGDELWTSDGTANGTRVLLTRNQSVGGIELGSANVLDGEAYFAISGATELEIWRSDGTRAGTSLVLSYPYEYSPPLGLAWVAKLGGRLFFALPNAQAGTVSLWSSLGHPSTSAPLNCPVCSRLAAGGSASWVRTIGSGVLFAAAAGGQLTLWAIDSNLRVTSLANLCPTGCSPGGPPVESGSNFYFYAGTEFLSPTLWKTDGTPGGTVSVLSFAISYAGLIPFPARNLLLLPATMNTHLGAGLQLWATSGTAGSTLPVTQVGTTGAVPSSITAAGSRVVFLACGNPPGLWGAGAADANLALDTQATIVNCLLQEQGVFDLVSVGANAFFAQAPSFTGGRDQVWRTRGDAASTTSIFTGSSPTAGIDAMAGFQGQLVFGEHDGSVERLWMSDGSSTTRMLTLPIAGGIYSLTPVGSRLYFVGGDQVWQTDGSTAGTVQLTNEPLGELTLFHEITAAARGVFFVGQSGLWSTDGTPAGTTLLFPLAASNTNSNKIDMLYGLGGTLIFQVTRNGTSTLWRTLGTPDSTQEIAAVRVTNKPASAQLDGALLDGRLYVAADDGVHGVELWRTDGTAGGTALVKDIAPGQLSSYVHDLVSLGGRVYFSAFTPATGFELWQSDGTETGTQLVSDIIPGHMSSNPTDLTIAGSLLFFSATDMTHGRQLWVYLPPTFALPAAPSSLTASALSPRQVQLQWQDNSSGQASFHIEMRIASGFQEVAVVPAGATAWVKRGLRPHTRYVFRVRAENTAGYSGYSNRASVLTP